MLSTQEETIMECDGVCHLRHNECFECIDILKCFHVLEYKSCRRYSFSREDNFLLKSDNSTTNIFKFFSVLELQGG